MNRLPTLDPAAATGKTKSLFAGIEARLGMVPNMIRVLANSPAALESYLALNSALDRGKLGAPLRERVALAVAEANGCGYCLAAHSAIGQMVGLAESELVDARLARAEDTKTDAALKFARVLVENRGRVSDEDLDRVRAAGYSDAEITGLVAEVALNLLTNYLNITAGTEVDFPQAPSLTAAA